MTNLSSEWLICHQKVETEAESEPKLEPAKKPSVKPYVPPVPFPQRLIKQKIDKQFSNFLDMFTRNYILIFHLQMLLNTTRNKSL